MSWCGEEYYNCAPLVRQAVTASRELARSLGLGRATAMVVGTIIGASIFVQPANVTGAVHSVAGVFGVWLASGLLTLCGALVCAELVSAFPRTGGVYVFLREAFSPAAGFVWGWAMFWSMHSGIIAAISVVFARYVGYVVPLGPWGIRGVAVATIVLLSAINYLGVREGSALQTAFTVVKVAAIGAIIVGGFWLGRAVPRHFVAGSATTSAWGPALVAGLFAFGGWHMVTYAAGETFDPARTIPRALLIGVPLVTLCYVALNAVYLYILPLDAVARSSRVAADAADVLLGRGGGTLLTALVLFSTFGGLSGIVLAGPRVYFSMAQDGLLFRWLGAVHPRFHTPARAIVLQAVWSSVLVASDTYQALFTRVVYTEWIFFALLAVGLFVLRRRPGYAPRYRIAGFPVVPALFVVASLGIVLREVAADPRNRLGGLLFVLLGWPVYHWWVRLKPTDRGTA